jgi:hypothetical protein
LIIGGFISQLVLVLGDANALPLCHTNRLLTDKENHLIFTHPKPQLNLLYFQFVYETNKVTNKS